MKFNFGILFLVSQLFLLGTSPVLAANIGPEKIAVLQSNLNLLGYNAGSQNGKLGWKTQSAASSYLKALGISAKKENVLARAYTASVAAVKVYEEDRLGSNINHSGLKNREFVFFSKNYGTSDYGLGAFIPSERIAELSSMRSAFERYYASLLLAKKKSDSHAFSIDIVAEIMLQDRDMRRKLLRDKVKNFHHIEEIISRTDSSRFAEVLQNNLEPKAYRKVMSELSKRATKLKRVPIEPKIPAVIILPFFLYDYDEPSGSFAFDPPFFFPMPVSQRNIKFVVENDEGNLTGDGAELLPPRLPVAKKVAELVFQMRKNKEQSIVYFGVIGELDIDFTSVETKFNVEKIVASLSADLNSPFWHSKVSVRSRSITAARNAIAMEDNAISIAKKKADAELPYAEFDREKMSRILNVAGIHVGQRVSSRKNFTPVQWNTSKTKFGPTFEFVFVKDEGQRKIAYLTDSGKADGYVVAVGVGFRGAKYQDVATAAVQKYGEASHRYSSRQHWISKSIPEDKLDVCRNRGGAVASINVHEDRDRGGSYTNNDTFDFNTEAPNCGVTAIVDDAYGGPTIVVKDTRFFHLLFSDFMIEQTEKKRALREKSKTKIKF